MPPASIATWPVWLASSLIIVTMIALLVATVASNVAESRHPNVQGDTMAVLLAVSCAAAFVSGIHTNGKPPHP